MIAHYDDETIVVYQAYNAAIGRFAAEHGYFGGAFSYTRMSWIKPNFLWMMFRSGWGTKQNQEVTLAIWVRRAAFEMILAQAVPSTFVPELYESEAEWKKRVASSDVRVQWDPDHGPTAAPLARRAVQLGLRGEVLRRYRREWIVKIEDISAFVATQRANATPSRYASLKVPREAVYPLTKM